MPRFFVDMRIYPIQGISRERGSSRGEAASK